MRQVLINLYNNWNFLLHKIIYQSEPLENQIYFLALSCNFIVEYIKWKV